MSISIGDLEELAGSSSKAVRNGFLDTGRLPLGRVCRAGEGMTGDAALLRKGLLEDRLSDPGEERRSGIDGSAIMIVPLVLSLLHTQSQQTSQEPEAGWVGRLSLVSRVS